MLLFLLHTLCGILPPLRCGIGIVALLAVKFGFLSELSDLRLQFLDGCAFEVCGFYDLGALLFGDCREEIEFFTPISDPEVTKFSGSFSAIEIYL